MAEINNSLAASIQSNPIDISKPLLAAGQINALRTKSALEEASTAQTLQETAHRQGLYDRNDNYNPSEVNTLAEAHQKEMGIAGSIGNILVNDPSPSGVRQAIDMAKKAGKQIDPTTEQHLLTSPPQQIVQYGKNMQAAGQQSTANVEQNPSAIAQRSGAAAGGALAGQTGDVYEPPKPKPMTSAQVNNSVSSQRNADGSPRVLSMEGSVPVQPNAPPAQNPLLRQKQVEAQGAELTGNAQKNVEEFAGYKTAAANSSTTKTVLRSLQDDAERVYTGKGAEGKIAAQKWVLAASQLPGVGPLVKHIAGDQTDPVAAAENIRKNIGIISRTAVGDIHETAAAALDSVQRSLPTEETSSKGLKLATSQMMAIEDFKQARLQAASKWQEDHGGTLNGFSADWNKNMGPATFVMARLPKDEQIAVRERLNKTTEGKRTIEAIDRQLKWGHEHNLDAVID